MQGNSPQHPASRTAAQRPLAWASVGALAVYTSLAAAWPAPPPSPLERPSPGAIWEATAALASAEAAVETARAAAGAAIGRRRRPGQQAAEEDEAAGWQPCAPLAGEQRFRCGEQPWQWAGVHATDAGGGPRRLLWLHALPGGRRGRLRWRDVPAGTLRGLWALERGAGGGAAVVLQLASGGKTLQTVEVTSDLQARPFEVELPSAASATDLELRWHALEDGRRLSVLELVVVPPSGAEARRD